jgi:cytochrome oxidase assembly protein ShyY1
MDIGRFVDLKHAVDDDTKFNIINNHLGYATQRFLMEHFVYPVCYSVMRQGVMAENCLICSKSL